MAHQISRGSSHSINTNFNTMPSQWTLVSWVNFSNLTGPPSFFRKDQNSAPYLDGILYYNSNLSAWVLEWSYSTTWANYQYSHFGNSADVHVCLTWDQSTAGNDPTLYYDGSSQTPSSSQASAGTRSNRSSVDLYLFSGLTFGSDHTPNADVWDMALYDRILSQDEIDALAAGFSPLLIPSGLQLYYPAERSTLYDVMGTYAPTYTTGGLTTNRSVWWPEEPIYSDTVPSGALVGSTSVSFSVDGIIEGTTALQASSTLDASLDGTIEGTTALQASSTFDASTSGVVEGAGELLGSSTFDASLDGTIEGTTALQAASSLSATLDGILEGTTALQGGSTLDAVGDASLVGSGELLGSTTFTASLDGSLHNGTAGAIAGAAAVSFSGTGVMEGTGSLAGASTFGAVGDASLVGVGVLSGGTTLSTSAGGVLFGIGALQGTSTLSTTAIAAFANALLAGSSSLSVSSAASLMGLGALTGATTFSVSSTGIISSAAVASIIGAAVLTSQGRPAAALQGTDASPAASVLRSSRRGSTIIKGK